jgi:acetylglutamate synthase
MIGIAGHIDQLAVLDVVQESAGIGTVVWACTAHDAIASV